MRRKIQITVIGIIALMCVCVGATLSYLTDRESITNVFTVGDLEIDLKEPDWNPGEGDGENVYPGYCVYKNPTIKNITSEKGGEQPCYARMRILLMDRSGELIADETRLSLIRTMICYDDTYTGTFDGGGTGEILISGRIPGYSLKELRTLPIVNPLFVIDEEKSSANEIVCNYMGSDGKGILKINEQVTLFTTLAVPVEWTNEEMRCLGEFEIVVKAEAIQAAGFTDQDTAFEALDAQMELAADTM